MSRSSQSEPSFLPTKQELVGKSGTCPAVARGLWRQGGSEHDASIRAQLAKPERLSPELSQA